MGMPMELQASPREVLARWPADRPLAVVWAGGSRAGTTLIARPTGTPTIVRDLDHMPEFLTRSIGAGDDGSGGGWVGWISYDLGRELEPRARHAGGAARDRDWPLMAWARVEDALAFDHARGRWSGIGNWRGIVASLGGEDGSSGAWPVLRSGTGASRYERDVTRVIEYLRAGDAYQVNLAHRLSGSWRGSARALFGRLIDAADPWHGGYVEGTEGAWRFAVASASPELFLAIDPATRRVETCPMKGTAAGEARPGVLESPKDHAELAMIVDLMRNDLSRVCDLGSVCVERARGLERHGAGSAGLVQATATVAGTLRAGVTLLDVLRGAFPGGSVTGAPKIRAMQIIDELEPARRGPYCGSMGFVADSGAATLNVAIRTLAFGGVPAGAGMDAIDGVVDYWVGAGIVADSDPGAEWVETLDKARIAGGMLDPSLRGTGR